MLHPDRIIFFISKREDLG